MKKAHVNRASKDGTPERIRTSDLVFRKHPLYPTELREHTDGVMPLAKRSWAHFHRQDCRGAYPAKP